MQGRHLSVSSYDDDNNTEDGDDGLLFPQIAYFSRVVSQTNRRHSSTSNNRGNATITSNNKLKNNLRTTDRDAEDTFENTDLRQTSTNSTDINVISDDSSITTAEIKQKIENTDSTVWEKKTHERFFFTKLFDLMPPTNQDDLSDFMTYDRMVRKEAHLEAKTTKILEELQDTHMKVNVDLEARFKAGDEYTHSEQHQYHKLKQSFKTRNKKQNTKNKKQEKINMYVPSSDTTEIIDLSNNHLAKNLFKLDEESTTDNNDNDNGNKPGGSDRNSDPSLDFSNNNSQYHLQRKLEKHQIQMIALGGTLGVGLFLSSGKAFSIGGPLGCLLGFMISGSIVLATMLSFAEMSTLIPTTSSISGLASRFVEDAFGFALGWSYWLSFTIAMPGEVSAAVIMLSYFEELNIPGLSSIGFVVLFLMFIIGINLLDVRIYGNIEFLFSFFKVMLTVVLIIVMLVVNVKEKYGFKYWRPSMSTDWETYGPFRPTFDLTDIGNGALNGIGGVTGRFLSVLASSVISAYAFSGSEIGFIASMECKNPRKALPSVTKRVFGRVMILYFLSIFMVGLDMYSGDPRLLRYYAPKYTDVSTAITQEHLAELATKCPVRLETQYPNGNQSPWIIALQTAGYCSFGTVLNAMLILFATSAGSSHLYTSSRTLYSMAIQAKAPSIFARCSQRGVPYYSVLFCGAFGTLAFASISSNAMSVFQDYANISSTTVMLMWAGMCISFLRFYYGLKYRPDIIARDDKAYPYRSPFQPFLAIYGLFGSIFIAGSTGFVSFIHGYWNVKTFFTAYGAIIIFAGCYVGYKLTRSSRIQRLDQLDLDSGRREMDRMIWDEEKFKPVGFVEMGKSVLGWLR